MKYDNEIKKAKLWLGVICFFVFFEGVNVGYGVYHYMTTKRGIAQMFIAVAGAVICSACAFVMCRVIARYHVMNYKDEQFEALLKTMDTWRRESHKRMPKVDVAPEPEED